MNTKWGRKNSEQLTSGAAVFNVIESVETFYSAHASPQSPQASAIKAFREATESYETPTGLLSKSTNPEDEARLANDFDFDFCKVELPSQIPSLKKSCSEGGKFN